MSGVGRCFCNCRIIEIYASIFAVRALVKKKKKKLHLRASIGEGTEGEVKAHQKTFLGGEWRRGKQEKPRDEHIIIAERQKKGKHGTTLQDNSAKRESIC